MRANRRRRIVAAMATRVAMERRKKLTTQDLQPMVEPNEQKESQSQEI
jgi:hypothetical protein